MNLKVTMYPHFSAKNIIYNNITKPTEQIKRKMLNNGIKTSGYIKAFINSSRKRSGGTGNLAKHMKLDVLINTPDSLSWGIGNIDNLNSTAKYWYVVNYGKRIDGSDFIPGGGMYIPRTFTDGPADASYRGVGVSRATVVTPNRGGEKLPSKIRPMNYIENSSFYLKGLIAKTMHKLGK